MKKLFSAFIVAVGLSVGISAIAQSTVGSGNLLFFVTQNGTILTPVVNVNGNDYGFFNLAGQPIDTNGVVIDSPFPSPPSPDRINQNQVKTAIENQYNSGNSLIIITNPPPNLVGP